MCGDLEELGEFEEAINCYDKALKLNPEHEIAREYKEACLQKFREKKTRKVYPITVKLW